MLSAEGAPIARAHKTMPRQCYNMEMENSCQNINFTYSKSYPVKGQSSLIYNENNTVDDTDRGMSIGQFGEFLEDSMFDEDIRNYISKKAVDYAIMIDMIDKNNGIMPNRLKRLVSELPETNRVHQYIKDRSQVMLSEQNTNSPDNYGNRMKYCSEEDTINPQPQASPHTVFREGCFQKEEKRSGKDTSDTPLTSGTTYRPSKSSIPIYVTKTEETVKQSTRNSSEKSHSGEKEPESYERERRKVLNLSLKGNGIGPSIPDFSIYINLRMLNLSHNRITTFNYKVLEDMPLTELNLSYNQIGGYLNFQNMISSGVERDGLKSSKGGIYTLQKLDLSFNSILAISGISCLPKVMDLNLDGNSFTVISEIDTKNSQLRKLSMKEMKYSLVSATINGVPGVNFPHLAEFSVDGFPEMAFWKEFPSTLKKLEIYRSCVEYLPSFDLIPRTLRILKLRNILGLVKIPLNFKTHFHDMEELYFSNNRLDSCQNIVSCIPTQNLTTIDLSGNPVARKYEIQQREGNLRNKDINEMTFAKNSHDLVDLLRMACPNITAIYISSSDNIE